MLGEINRIYVHKSINNKCLFHEIEHLSILDMKLDCLARYVSTKFRWHSREFLSICVVYTERQTGRMRWQHVFCNSQNKAIKHLQIWRATRLNSTLRHYIKRNALYMYFVHFFYLNQVKWINKRNAVLCLLGNLPASELLVPTFRNLPAVPSS